MKFLLEMFERSERKPMNSQMDTRCLDICSFSSLPLFMIGNTIRFSPQDCGYEIVEGEIVNGMLDQAIGQLTCTSIPEVSPEEFETVYGCFLA